MFGILFARDFIGHGWNPDPVTGEYSWLATIVSGVILLSGFWWLFGPIYKELWRWMSSGFKD